MIKKYRRWDDAKIKSNLYLPYSMPINALYMQSLRFQYTSIEFYLGIPKFNYPNI